MNFEEYLHCKQFNLLKLKAYAFKLYLFLMECYHFDKISLEACVCGRATSNIQVKKANSL